MKHFPGMLSTFLWLPRLLTVPVRILLLSPASHLAAQLKVLAHFHLKLIVGERNSCPRHNCAKGAQHRTQDSQTTTEREQDKQMWPSAPSSIKRKDGRR